MNCRRCLVTSVVHRLNRSAVYWPDRDNSAIGGVNDDTALHQLLAVTLISANTVLHCI